MTGRRVLDAEPATSIEVWGFFRALHAGKKVPSRQTSARRRTLPWGSGKFNCCVRRDRFGEPVARTEPGDIVMKRLSASVLMVALVTQLGCSAIQDPTWSKPVTWRTWVPALVCAAAGAGIGIAIQNGRSSEAVFDPATGQQIKSASNPPLWEGAAIGAPIGAVVCGVLAHLFLDPPAPEPTPTPIPTPEPTPVVVVTRRIVLRGVSFFDFDQAQIQPQSYPVLDEAVLILKEYPDVHIVVEGYTDDVGTEEYNMQLSIRRAEAVFRYLVNSGIEPERIRIEGFGESHPVADNSTPEGRAENRRVEIRMVQ